MEVRSGRTLQPGVALGPVYVQLPRRTGEEPSTFQGEREELARFEGARQRTLLQLDQLYRRTREQVGEEQAEVFHLHRLMLEEGYALLNGVRLLLKGSGAKQAYVCLEDNKPQAAENLNEILSGMRKSGVMEDGEQIEIAVLPTKYPEGGERQLIQAVTGREVPMGGLPADVGVIVSNVATARAAADMILGGLPLIRRIVTVTGCVKEPGNYLVPVGTSAKELVELAGGVTVEKNRIIAGGPMTGPCVASDWNGEDELFYITKNTSGILVLPDSACEEQPCIRCGGCESVCPAGLTPWQIDFAFQQEDYDLCEKLYASECIACGCCSYICPAKRELTLRTRMARDAVKQRMRERAVKKA